MLSAVQNTTTKFVSVFSGVLLVVVTHSPFFKRNLMTSFFAPELCMLVRSNFCLGSNVFSSISSYLPLPASLFGAATRKVKVSCYE